jgi:hypothetical protein
MTAFGETFLTVQSSRYHIMVLPLLVAEVDKITVPLFWRDYRLLTCQLLQSLRRLPEQQHTTVSWI